MDILHAIILAAVEGVTEFLPISSTGHLILASKVLNIPQTDFVKTYEIVIQSGAIAAIVVLYLKELVCNISVLKKVLIAFIPTGIVGLVLYRTIKEFLIGNFLITVLALFIGGVLLIVIERYFKGGRRVGSIQNLTPFQALAIGVAQSLSVIPGTSRAAATILGGMFIGLSRGAAVRFSFLLAIPTMLAATGLDLAKNLDTLQSTNMETLATGTIVSFGVAWISVKWLISYIQRSDFTAFGIYRIILAILFFAIFR